MSKNDINFKKLDKNGSDTNYLNNTNINNSNKKMSNFFNNTWSNIKYVGKKIKKGIKTVKKDFVEDMQENYNFITTAYNEINKQKEQIHQEQISQLKKQCVNNIENINNTKINNNIDIDQYYDNLLSFMIEEHKRKQKQWIRNNESERINKVQYESLIDTKLMSDNFIKENNIKSRSCSVCQDQIVNGENCVLTQCHHLYHDRCSKEWFTNKCIKPTCTICKRDVREIIN